ncbi:MAG: HAD-IIA family hydrolase [Desulfomonilaceae bacterium]|nr:HAD-IIA family hydrolase [Desulfomonilaceae bacterium]
MSKKTYQGILADLDGTVHRGRVLMPGVAAAYRDLTRKGIRWVFVSNGATSLSSDIAERLRGLGLDVRQDQVVNSATALINALRAHEMRTRVMVIGEPRLIEGIEDAGVEITEDPSGSDIVVVALDTGFSYEKLRRAHLALQRGALFWATNTDASFPASHGFLPGAGSIVAAVATASGRPPDRVFGKPSRDMAETALDRLNVEAESCLMVGDRIETDIVFAKNAGIDSALVLTGASTRQDLARSSHQPDYVFDDMSGIVGLFR